MLSKLYKILKKITVSFFMLYGYNILVPIRALIPINICTVAVITLLKIPGLFLLIVIKIIIY